MPIRSFAFCQYREFLVLRECKIRHASAGAKKPWMFAEAMTISLRSKLLFGMTWSEYEQELWNCCAVGGRYEVV